MTRHASALRRISKGAKRVVEVDVTGLPLGALFAPASTHENGTSQLMLEHLTREGVKNTTSSAAPHRRVNGTIRALSRSAGSS